MKPLLSICIPTYQRADYLNLLLNNLLPQIHAYGICNFQLIVSDNCSNDETKNVVENNSQIYHVPIEYSCNDHNIGLSNLDLVASRALGDYILLLGDDDLFSPNFIEIVMKYVQSPTKYGIIHWNRLKGDADCMHNVLHDVNYTSQVTYSFDEFLLRTMSFSNFMSSVIFHRDCWEMGEDMLQDNWVGYRWWARILFGANALKLPCVYYYFPLVVQRNPVREWTSKGIYYALVEMGQIFYKLDGEVPGVFEAWKKLFHDSQYYNVQWHIDNVKLDLNFYRQHAKELEICLEPKEIELLRMWLHADDVERAQRKYYKKQKIKRMLKNFINKLV